MNWRDVVKKDLQRMGLTWEEVETSAHRGVIVWPYASVMRDEGQGQVQ